MGESTELAYARQIATYLWERHYKEISPDWEPLNSLMGVLTQIDNMTCGLHITEKEQWSCNKCGRYVAPEFKASHVCPSEPPSPIYGTLGEGQKHPKCPVCGRFREMPGVPKP